MGGGVRGEGCGGRGEGDGGKMVPLITWLFQVR